MRHNSSVAEEQTAVHNAELERALQAIKENSRPIQLVSSGDHSKEWQ